MISYIKGKLVDISPAAAVVEANGMGYYLNISLNTFSAIQNAQEVQLYTYLHVKNEGGNVGGIELFGFKNPSEREMFLKLISVSGIGGNTARLMLSSLSAEEIASAILSGNVALIQSIKGVGPKTAQRVVLELRDKMSGVQTKTENGQGSFSSAREEALLALTALGIARNTAEKAVNKVIQSKPEAAVESLIKEALKIV